MSSSDLPSGPGKPERTAYSRALDLLARRDRSCSELGELLSRGGFAPSEVEAALRRVVELGYLNEERLAGAIIRSERLAGRGPRAAWLKLKRRGIEGWNLEKVQAEWRGEPGALPEGTACDPELEAAVSFVRRRYPDLSSGALKDRKQAQRALGALLRRGFSFDVARKALEMQPD